MSHSVFGNHLHKRTSDSVIVDIQWWPLAQFVANQKATFGPGWVTYDGLNYANITETQLNTGYTPVGYSSGKLQGR